MSGRAETLIRDWETRLHANALASRILATLNERKSEVQRCALDGLARENPQFERATTKQFRDEAVGQKGLKDGFGTLPFLGVAPSE